MKAWCEKHLNDIEIKVVHNPEDILKENPDIIGIYTVTELWPHTLKIIKELRENFEGLIVLGGQHISALPQLLPEEVDCAVLSEGEETFKDLIENFQKYGKKINYANIDGIIYHQDTQILQTKPRKPLNLNVLPLPADVPEDHIPVSTTRGCLYKCTHCVESPFHSKIRFMSAERIAEILLHYYETESRTKFHFLDDLFIAYPARLDKLHQILKQKNLLNTFIIHKVSLNANLVTPDIIRKLKEIGVEEAGMGMESLSDPVLSKFKNGVVTVDQIEKALKIAKSYDFSIGGSIVTGYPGETAYDLKITLDRVREYQTKYNYRFWQIYLCQPLPGSPLWHKALNEGKVSLNMDFSTMRIDGDIVYFDTPYYYGNEEALPQEEYLNILESKNFLESGKYKFIHKEEEQLAQKFKTYYTNLIDKTKACDDLHNKIQDIFNQVKNKKFLIFGTGFYAQYLLHNFKVNMENLVGFVTTQGNNGKKFLEHPVYNIDQLEKVEYNSIIIASKVYEIEIKNTLQEKLPPDKEFYSLHDEFLFF
jgi:radical SAM superfamily enzyme YgiQ (UPF0313 family)